MKGIEQNIQTDLQTNSDAKQQHWGHGLKGDLCLQQIIVDSLLLSLLICQSKHKDDISITSNTYQFGHDYFHNLLMVLHS